MSCKIPKKLLHRTILLRLLGHAEGDELLVLECIELVKIKNE